MAHMKGDMSGAAAVLGSMWGIANLAKNGKIKGAYHFIGLIPLCENMPSSNACKPGDILVASNGKTVEVDNTDAEGRLILADALHYAHNFAPESITDLATLTG
jgi:aminopeptidase